MSLTTSLEWRYATKKMNGRTVLQETVDKIIEAAHLAPTSVGLQPFRIIQITNPALKEQIRPIASNQSQITDCSHLLVFAAWDKYTKERIEGVVQHTVAERQLPETAMDDLKQHLLNTLVPQSAEENFAHAARQAYIGFGVAIAAAAELRVDATPMEGFNNQALDELLDLKTKGLKSVTLLPLGYRAASEDWLVNLKKVRTPRSEFVIEVA